MQPSDQVFAFQNGEQCHWEYDWNSGTSQRQRARTHILRAYAFVPIVPSLSTLSTARKSKSRAKKKSPSATASKDATWQVVGIATSTPFTISAYRKPTETEQHSPSVLPNQSREVIQVDDDSDASGATGTDPEPEDTSEIVSASHLILPPEFRKLLWEKRNSTVVNATTSLSILALFTSQIQLQWLSPNTLGRSLLPLLRFWRNPGPIAHDIYGYSGGDHHSSIGNDQERLLMHYVNYCAPRLVALLTTDVPADSQHEYSYPSRHGANSDSEDDEESGLDESTERLSSLAEQCFELVCSLLEYDQWSLVERFVRDAASSSEASSEAGKSEDDCEGSEADYARFVSLLTHLLNESLAKDAMKLGLLVDDIVSSIYKDRSEPANFAPFVLEQVESLLRNTKVLGLELFQAQVHVVGICQAHQHFGDAQRSLGFRPPSDFTGRWVCRTIEPSQRRLSMMAEASNYHAVPVILTLLRTFGFDLEVVEGGDFGDGPVATQVSIHSLASLFPEVGTCFALDNEFHSINYLPCGMSAAWLLKLVLGGELPTSDERLIEYRGSVAPSESNGVVVLLDVFLYAGAAVGVRVHAEMQLLRLKHQHKRSFDLKRKPQALSPHATRTRLQAQVTLSKGKQRSQQEPPQRIDDWDEELGFTATYDRHFSGSLMESDDRTVMTQAPTAFTISREDEGDGELSAVV